MMRSARTPGDLSPLQPRLATLFVLRLALAVTVFVAAALLPTTITAPARHIAVVVACYLLLTVATELVRQARTSLATWSVGAAVLVDGVFIAAALTLAGGPGHGLSFVLYVHLIAVTLLASYRTGLKVAVWQSLLLIVTHYLPPSVTGVTPLSLSDAVFGVMTFLAVAVVTAICSALNERELRRSRSGFQALATMASELEDVHNPDEVVGALLAGVARAFTVARAAVYLEDGKTLTVAVQGRMTRTDLPAEVDDVVVRCWTERGPVLRKRLDALRDPALGAALPGARNVVVLPFTADGEPAGALIVERGGGLNARIGASTIALLSQFTVHAALAHRNVRLLAEVKHLATVDGLTGLANRRTFEDALHREVSRAVRSGDDLSLLLVDVDHFKRVNDTYGHPMGDEVLRHVGRVLSSRGRDFDFPARYGGEEFVVILPGCSPDEAIAVAERLRAGIAGTDAPLPVTASVGVASLHRDASDGEALVKAADEALYDAKVQGRDRTAAATSRLRAVVA